MAGKNKKFDQDIQQLLLKELYQDQTTVRVRKISAVSICATNKIKSQTQRVLIKLSLFPGISSKSLGLSWVEARSCMTKLVTDMLKW